MMAERPISQRCNRPKCRQDACPHSTSQRKKLKAALEPIDPEFSEPEQANRIPLAANGSQALRPMQAHVASLTPESRAS